VSATAQQWCRARPCATHLVSEPAAVATKRRPQRNPSPPLPLLPRSWIGEGYCCSLL
jgi:hypothetical protein